jgi:hypothetical protein
MRNANFEFRMRNVAVYVKTGERWLWVSGQSTKLPLRPKAATVNPQIFNSYLGQYEIGANRFLIVALEGDKLVSQTTGRPKLELIPKSETEFIRFSEENDYGNSEIVFVRDEKDKLLYAVYKSDGKEIWRAKKVK